MKSENHVADTELLARPMAPQAMEFISDMGSLFQQYVSDELTLDEFCKRHSNLLILMS